MSQLTKTYNLQNRRTLPRQVIKWIQGLDLSYSLKDFRKDMSNGYLIGEIISRYEPRYLPMHAFDNSQNAKRRDNNWSQLRLFFSKHSLRNVRIDSEDYQAIASFQDPNYQQLYHFICKLYSICTKKTLSQNPPPLGQSPTKIHNPNATTSYILKENGLERFQSSLNMGSNSSHALDNSQYSQEKPQDRVPTRKIGAASSSPGNGDILGTGVKNERKLTSKKKSWNMDIKDESNYVPQIVSQSEQGLENQKLIFDYLSEILEECLPDDPSLRNLIFPQKPKFSLTEILTKTLPAIDHEYLCTFLAQVNLHREELAAVMLREINETWKFFRFFFKFLRHYPFESQEFALLSELLSNYASECQRRQPKRMPKIFLDSLIENLITEIKCATAWRKKQRLMQLASHFVGQGHKEKKALLIRLKNLIGSINTFFIHWLSILVPEQASKANSSLIEDYIYYALQYTFSPVASLRTPSLKILYEVSKTANLSLINGLFIQNSDQFQHCRHDSEQAYLLIAIYYNLLRQVRDSKEYQNIVKNYNSSNLVKAYNPDNEKIEEELKKKVEGIVRTIYGLFNQAFDNNTKELTAKMAVTYFAQSHLLMEIFLEYGASLDNGQLLLKEEPKEYNFKSMSVKCPPVNRKSIQQFSNELIMVIIGMLKIKTYKLQNFLWMLNFCLEHINVKKVSMEGWDNICAAIVQPYCRLFGQPQVAAIILEGLKSIYNIHFNFDIKIPNFTRWIAASVHQSANVPLVSANANSLLKWMKDIYTSQKQEIVRNTIEQLSELFKATGISYD